MASNRTSPRSYGATRLMSLAPITSANRKTSSSVALRNAALSPVAARGSWPGCQPEYGSMQLMGVSRASSSVRRLVRDPPRSSHAMRSFANSDIDEKAARPHGCGALDNVVFPYAPCPQDEWRNMVRRHSAVTLPIDGSPRVRYRLSCIHGLPAGTHGPIRLMRGTVQAPPLLIRA